MRYPMNGYELEKKVNPTQIPLFCPTAGMMCPGKICVQMKRKTTIISSESIIDGDEMFSELTFYQCKRYPEVIIENDSNVVGKKNDI